LTDQKNLLVMQLQTDMTFSCTAGEFVKNILAAFLHIMKAHEN